MKRLPLIGVLLLVCAPATIAYAQTPTARAEQAALARKVDSVFHKFDKPDSPGAAVIVVKDGKVVYRHGYGRATLEYDVPITPSTVFHVASVSKQFTACAILLLEHRGKLSLDDDIRKYLPEVPDFGKTIKIRHLLTHTSGLRDQWELLAMAGWRLDDVITREHILKMVRHQRELNFDPGAEYLYCNTGFTLLGVIVERISGQSLREFADDNIFVPLGMSSTHFHDDHETIVKNRAYSYYPEGDGFKSSPLNYANVGATSLFTTADDMAKWIANFDTPRVGDAALIAEMQQPGTLNNGKKISYAFGLDTGQYKGLKTVAHGGSDAGYRSFVVRFPDQRFAVAVLSNLSTSNPGALAFQVADIYLANAFPPAAAKAVPDRPVATVDPAIYDAYVGKYQFPEGLVIEITRENNRLWGQPAGLPRAELLPASATTFFARVNNAELTFERNDGGDVGQIVLNLGGNRSVGKKVLPVTLTAAQMAEYAGDYYSDELGTTYTLVVHGNGLVAEHRRNDDIKLTVVDRDYLTGTQWFFQQVRFVRDKDGRVTGFRLTGSRVRNMRFDRQSH